MRILFAFLVAASMVPTLVAQPPLVIHEWGTFTNLQDESGNSVGGINSDDEPLPKFAHDLAWNWNVGDAASQQTNRMKQGYPRCHPDVTIRLETPVLYFHPAPGAPTPAVNVEVQFAGTCFVVPSTASISAVSGISLASSSSAPDACRTLRISSQ